MTIDTTPEYDNHQREMLELAARMYAQRLGLTVAGYDYGISAAQAFNHHGRPEKAAVIAYSVGDQPRRILWNPLLFPDQALSLAVVMGERIEPPKHPGYGAICGNVVVHRPEMSTLALTCLAVVMCAAQKARDAGVTV